MQDEKIIVWNSLNRFGIFEKSQFIMNAGAFEYFLEIKCFL